MTDTPSPPIILLTGRAAPLPGSGAQSGIAKSPVDRPLALGPEGVEGDEQADRRVHGGVEKAVHHYPFDHYATWRDELGDLPPLDAPGGFGENISAAGLTEATVAVGDVFRLGGALLQVSQGRQPCWKLNRRFDLPDMARRVQESGRTGWYYRVLQPGTVAPGDRLERIDRLAPDWTLRRLWHALYVDRLNLAELEGIAALDVLAEGWRKYAVRRLESRRVEDWSKRLDGTS
ncbi:MOSC domain-containing protein [Celeribacter indicus]|uniref:MOSC domain-containing protein n=1 Tax=Celeribacter indicus TaxID=1208324 RepID=A0A0B5E5A6_9RHOB|nr:MOSC domain-containing protein [Celeribacter indicus]AJE47542.1 MOSC domain-containing protein [Celeribacter indicus]SDW09681.1 MOSC domain-containing protein YiiM [Celeribacter indicus]